MLFMFCLIVSCVLLVGREFISYVSHIGIFFEWPIELMLVLSVFLSLCFIVKVECASLEDFGIKHSAVLESESTTLRVVFASVYSSTSLFAV